MASVNGTPLDQTPDVKEGENANEPPLPEGDPTEKTVRIRKLTQKGLEYKLTSLKKCVSSMYNRMERQIGVVDMLLAGDNTELVNSETNNLDRIYTELSDAHARVDVAIADAEVSVEVSEEYVAITIHVDEADAMYFAAKETICSWLLLQEQRVASRQDDNRSLYSLRSRKSLPTSEHNVKRKRPARSPAPSARSSIFQKLQRSHRSGTSSGASRRSDTSSAQSKCSDMSLMQRAKVEGLKADAEAIKETHEAELKAKLLRVKQKIKKAEAIEKVYAQSAAMRKLPNAGANKETPSMNALNLDEKKTNLTHTTDLADKSAVPINNHCPTSDLHLAMIDMMKLQCAPRPDLDIFSGDPLEYCYFKTIFKEVVETAVPDQRGRLTRLIKYTNGDAKELIKHLVHADPSNCYNEAVALLDKEYGNDHILSCSYIKELRQWESVKQHDTTSFKKLYRFLLKCQAYRSGGRLVELDSTDMIRTVLSKVHTTHQERWNRKAIDIRKKQKREADFSDLVKFIEMEAALLSDPAYSRDALLEAKNQMKSFSTQLQDTPIDKDLHKS